MLGVESGFIHDFASLGFCLNLSIDVPFDHVINLIRNYSFVHNLDLWRAQNFVSSVKSFSVKFAFNDYVNKYCNLNILTFLILCNEKMIAISRCSCII